MGFALRMSVLAVSVLVAAHLCVGSSPVGADDVYGNQIKMTRMILTSTPAQFRGLCDGIGGKHTEDDETAMCEHEEMTLVKRVIGNRTESAKFAYPATPEDVAGLTVKAVEKFGPPDQVWVQALSWSVSEELRASAYFDDEHSVFAMSVRR